MKKLLRKRNKLVQMSINLKGEELKSIELSIKLIDFLINSSTDDHEQKGRKYVCINYEVIYLDDLVNNF